MSYNGSGTFLINTAGQPVVSGTVISSTAFNALTADLATGLSTAITKDGQTTVTANIPMSTYKFTGLGVGSAATDSANLSQVQSTVTKLLNSVSGADTITATASPTLAAYAAGQMFYFVAAGDNTTSVTLNIDSLGAKAVTRDGATALAASDIKSGEVVVVVYDGTRFQVVSQLNSAGDARFANVSIASSLYVGGVSTFVGNAGFSANVSIASALSVGGVAAITGATTIGGNLTLSGGTANGVLYLNGSKVATSGSALTFDGTTFANGAAWTTNPMASTQPQYFQYAAGTNFFQLAGDAGVGIRAVRFSNDASNPLIFLGKGRGTYASPAAVQTGDVAGNVRYDVYGGTNQRNIANISGGVETYTSDSNISGYLAFSTSPSGAANSSEKMRLTAAGDLGIGTASPAARVHAQSAGGAGVFNFRATTTNLVNPNSTGSEIIGAQISIGTNIILSERQVTGAFVDRTDLAFVTNTGFGLGQSEKMRLTAAGDLGIGTASPTQKLTVAGNILSLSAAGTDSYLNAATSGVQNTYLGFNNSGSTNAAGALNNYSYVGSGNNYGLQILSNGAAIATFTNTGNLGIGTASPGSRLHVAENGTGAYSFVRVTNSNSTATVLFGVGGSAVANSALQNNAIIYNTGNSAMVFGTNDAERMRITSTGNIVAGASAALATTATDGFLYVPTCAGTPTGTPTAITGMAPIVVNTTNNKLYFYSGGAWRDAGP